MVRTALALRRTAWVLLCMSLAFILCSAVLGVASLAIDSPRPEGSETVASELAFLLAILTFALVGFLIVAQQPSNAIGWLLGVVGLLLGWLDLTGVFIGFAVVEDLGTTRGVEVLMALTNWTWVPTVGLLAIFVVLLFPDGRLPSTRWRWLPWTAAVTMTMLCVGVLISPNSFDNSPLDGRDNPFAVELPSWVVAGEAIVFAIFVGCMLASAVAAIGRYRRSRGVERLQMKWLAFAGASVAGVFGLIALAGFLPSIEENAALGGGVQLALPLAFLAVPLAISAAVLKHGLYEIDVVINKTVVFGTLAAFITVVYVVIVVGLGTLVGRGDEPNLALSVAATAVVAVAFQPVRNKVQRFANHLVYGQRATPYEVLSEFVDRVAGTYDPAELLTTMARTVAEGVGATRADVWLTRGQGFVREATWPDDPDGRVPAQAAVDADPAPTGDQVVPVRDQGELLGAISVTKPAGEPLTPVEGKLLDDVAAQAGLVLRNVRLIEDLRGSRQRLVRAQDEERRRLERNLHDGAQQSLVAVALMIRMIRARLGEDSVPAGKTLDEATDQLSAAIDELRVLARGIHPAILSERGLRPAISALAERSPIPVVVVHELDDRPPVELEATLYYVAAEALANAAKHARASEVVVAVTRSGTELVLEVSDDGVGGCDRTRGTGILGLADRVSVVDGTLTITSPTGEGTRITCRLPLPLQSRSTDVAPALPRPIQPLGAGQ